MIVKSGRLWWSGHVAEMGRQVMHTEFVGETSWKMTICKTEGRAE
jgi:hypothetical protein